MKRKSLRLSKETVRSLSSEQMRDAAGASWRWCQNMNESASNCGGMICGPTAYPCLRNSDWTACTCAAGSCGCYMMMG